MWMPIVLICRYACGNGPAFRFAGLHTICLFDVEFAICAFIGKFLKMTSAGPNKTYSSQNLELMKLYWL